MTSSPIIIRTSDILMKMTHQPKIPVGWQGTDDPLNPHNFSFAKRMRATVVVSGLAFMVGVASVIDAAILPQSSAEFHVSEVVGSLATGSLFLLQSSSQKAHLFTISCLPVKDNMTSSVARGAWNQLFLLTPFTAAILDIRALLVAQSITNLLMPLPTRNSGYTRFR